MKKIKNSAGPWYLGPPVAGDPGGHEQAPAVVRDLVERFIRTHDAPEAGTRDAAELWRAFLAPLFAALGWDLACGPRTNACASAGIGVYIDACIEGRRALVVQVLAPAARGGGAGALDGAEALALRRRAWSAGVPLAVATSFAALAVYDCGRKPAPGDDATTARVLHLTCAEYAARWPELAALLAREAVAHARAPAPRRRRGRVAVDASLLADVDRWRRLLAQDLARRHRRPGQADQTVGELAQRTVDRLLGRILFLRMCEDRGIEPPGQLRRLASLPGVYAAMARLHRQAGARHGTVSDDIDVSEDMEWLDDDVLRSIIETLYHPECDYVFSHLPARVLGQIHEHFLGRQVHITAGGDATAVDRLDARKAGGVYYTPPHMVEHVVRHTVGAWLRGKTLRQARRIRIVDPACGAGAFLLGAYQYLLHWHEHACLGSDRAADRARLVRAADGTWRLGARERLRILGESIYGVDIDARAVQVTRQALLLEVLANAPEAAQGVQLRVFAGPGPAVPGLRSNLRCGNALVAPDFLATHGRDLDPAEADRARAFDWARAFPRVLGGLGSARPGFDVVLGNPPWGQKDIMESDAVKRYVRDRFQSLRGNYDLFRPFVEQGIRLLRRGAGRFGMVLPDIVLLKNYQDTRRYLLDHLTLTHIDWWGMPFPAAAIDAATLVGVHARPARAHAVHVAMRAPGRVTTHAIPQADFRANDRYVFNLALTPARRAIIARLARSPRLGDCFEVHEGVHSGNIRGELFVDHAVDGSCEPLLLGRDEIAPYDLRWAGRFIRLSALPARRGARYANAGRPAWFRNAKVLVRRTGDRVLAAVDRGGRYASNNFFVVLARAPGGLGLDGLCALLNSRLMTWYFRTIEPRKGRAFAELKIKHLSVFPLPDATARPDACAALERLGAARARQDDRETDHEMELEIDRAVYALFDLTAEEISVIQDGEPIASATRAAPRPAPRSDSGYPEAD